MDIENLSKTDIIFMALLISFVTSIMTAIVVIFLMEDAPDNVIRVSEQLIHSNEPTSTASATSSIEDSVQADASTDMSRDDILDQAVRAVVRVTTDDIPPQAGVLLLINDRDLVLTQRADYSEGAQALFEDGVVVDLQLESDSDYFSRLLVTAASDSTFPLSPSNNQLLKGDDAFVVPLTQRPEIIRVTVSAVDDTGIKTSAGTMPPTSLLFSNTGDLQGIYSPETESFVYIR
jgi:hypothetical protein